MSHQAPFTGPGFPDPYGTHDPYALPRRRRGLKRIVLGSVGLLLSVVGLVALPVLSGFVALIVAGVASSELTPLDPAGDAFTARTTSIYSIAVPEGEADGARCEVTGPSVSLDTETGGYSPGSVDGVPYVEVVEVQVQGGQEVSVRCSGVSAVAVSELNVVGTLAALGIGLVVAILAGIVSLVVLILGIVARVRS